MSTYERIPQPSLEQVAFSIRFLNAFRAMKAAERMSEEAVGDDSESDAYQRYGLALQEWHDVQALAGEMREQIDTSYEDRIVHDVKKNFVSRIRGEAVQEVTRVLREVLDRHEG